MSVGVASVLIRVAGAYLAVGVAFSVPFLTSGARRIDPSAVGSTVGFRMVVAPGVVALWPLLAYRWSSGVVRPSDRYTAHDRRASESAR